MSVKGKRLKVTVERTQTPSSGESGSEWLERGDHPLLNDLILTSLFGYVRRFDLKACRVVCMKWNFHTIPHMRATFRVTIGGSQSTQRNREIEDFVKLFSSNLLGIPFEKFNLGAFPTTNGVGEEFLQQCGKIATDIDLNGRESEVYTIEDVSQVLRSCPNLKFFGSPSRAISRSGDLVHLFSDSTPTFSDLKIIAFRLNFEERLCCPTFIEELMNAAPNVSDIESDPPFEGNVEEESRTVSVVLNGIEEQGKESSIQSLVLRHARIEDIEDLERMAENGLKLRSLTFVPQDRNVGGRDLIRLAAMFQSTLQVLKVEQSFLNILEEYPEMWTLKSLCLPGFNSDSKVVNLNDNFPALETLDIGLECNRMKWNDFFSQFRRCPSLKSLSVRRGAIQIHTFHNIQRSFPYLTKLDFRFTDDAFVGLRQVWTQTIQLESLTIFGSISKMKALELDSVFTGIPSQTLKGLKLNGVLNELKKMSVEERRERILKLGYEHSRFPSIRNLKKLRHLHLNLTGHPGIIIVVTATERVGGVNRKTHTCTWKTYHLSDTTGYLSFYSMNQLRHLEIENCSLTKTCCQMLTKETGLESWVFRKEFQGGDIIPPFVRHERENQYT